MLLSLLQLGPVIPPTLQAQTALLAEASGVWDSIGLLASLGVAALAWRHSLRPGRNAYERDVYGMSRGTHRSYALAALVFAGLFAAGLFQSGIPAVPILALFTVVGILYGSSFVRGASGEDE